MELREPAGGKQVAAPSVVRRVVPARCRLLLLVQLLWMPLPRRGSLRDTLGNRSARLPLGHDAHPLGVTIQRQLRSTAIRGVREVAELAAPRHDLLEVPLVVYEVGEFAHPLPVGCTEDRLVRLLFIRCRIPH